ncbi:hypothetical protein NDU88_000471 [Pleurodeles waltl]|uniref:Somatostatin/Cortistatin C-terminal domain-containing protein n=1 Tax=Pleurodeles waltl TaxID=8319 RepID=A0AAV7KQB4_PLEWA|nr:hypothetical protein NDU88_000471 [Pleurodeles waltl]
MPASPVLLLALPLAALLLSGAHGVGNAATLADLLHSQVPESKEELSRLLVLKALSDLLKTEDQAIPDGPEVPSGEVDLMRRLVTPRERKAGCKNFFWKTFTSC